MKLLMISLILCGAAFGSDQSIDQIGAKIAAADATGARFIDSREVFCDKTFLLSLIHTLKNDIPDADREMTDDEVAEAVKQYEDNRGSTYAILLQSVGKKVKDEGLTRIGKLTYIGGCYAPIKKMTTATGDGVGRAVLTFLCAPSPGTNLIIVLTPRCLKLGGEYRLEDFVPNDFDIIE